MVRRESVVFETANVLDSPEAPDWLITRIAKAIRLITYDWVSYRVEMLNGLKPGPVRCFDSN